MATTLICTLGTSSPVISETLDALLQSNGKVDKLVIIHTTFKEVFDKKLKDGTLIGLPALEEYLLKNSKEKFSTLRKMYKKKF